MGVCVFWEENTLWGVGSLTKFLDDDVHSRPEFYLKHISQGIDDISEQSPLKDRSSAAHKFENLPDVWQQDHDTLRSPSLLPSHPYLPLQL